MGFEPTAINCTIPFQNNGFDHFLGIPSMNDIPPKIYTLRIPLSLQYNDDYNTTTIGFDWIGNK